MTFLSFLLLLSVTFAAPALSHEVTACPELTTPQYLAGFLTLKNFVMFFAIGIGVPSLCYLCFRMFGNLLKVFLSIRVEVYEAFGYSVAFALIGAGALLETQNETWTSLIGSLLFGGMIIITGIVHEIEKNYRRFFGTLFVVWAAIAAFYGNEYVGFIAVGALLGLLGFSAAVIPLGYVLGFRDEKALARATSAAFILLSIFVGLRIAGVEHLPVLFTFEWGTLWFGTFVGYLGLLVASSVWYPSERASMILMQIIMVVACLTAVAIGLMFDISELPKAGGTFLILYLIEKPFEISTKSKTLYAAICLGTAVVAGGCAWWAQNNMEIVEPFLLF